MNIYNVGTEEISVNTLKELFNPKWVVYYYATEPYDGSGSLMLLNSDDMLYFINLCHCSCYGPLENFAGPVLVKDFDKISKEQFLNEEVFYYHLDDLVRNKVMELLND